MVGLPVAAYLTWEGRLIEDKGVSPSVSVELKPEQLLAGEDPQMGGLDPASKVMEPRVVATPQWSNIFSHCGLVSVAPNRPKRSCGRSSLRTFFGQSDLPRIAGDLRH